MLKYNSPFVVKKPFPIFRWMTPVFQPNQPKLYCGFSLCASAQIKSKHRIVLVVPKKNASIIPRRPIHPRRCNSQLVGRLKQPTNSLPIWLAQCNAAQPMSKRKGSQNAHPSIHPSAERQLTITQSKKTKKKEEKKRSEEKATRLRRAHNSSSESLETFTTSSPSSGRKLAQYSSLAWGP
jgi:hypothetical protein